MRTAFLAILASCGGAHRAAEPLSNPGEVGCTIRDARVQSLADIHIAIGGEEFAHLEGHFVELEATFENGTRRVRAATENVILTGELARFPVLRPRRRAPIDGWLVVDDGTVTDVLGSSLRLGVKLPSGVEPKSTSIVQPCSALTFASAPAHKTEGKPIVFAPGTTEIRAGLDGPVVARVTTRGPGDPRPVDEITAFELERRSGSVRVRVSDPNAVEGWVPAKAVREPDDADVYGGLMGNEMGETGAVHLRCAVAVPIYVLSRGEKVRVGALVPGGDVLMGAFTKPGTIAISLGVEKKGLVPFVDAADAAECKYETR